jgi:heat shock protein HslJ/membrane-bound inhibitor of C-type lysozyme
MHVPKVFFLLAGVSLVAACSGPADPEPREAATLVIRGELFYPERIALPPDSLAIVELRAADGGGEPLLAEQRIELEGRQVPIAFELTVDRAELDAAMPPSVRGAILSRPGPVRVTEPAEIDASQDVVELAPLRLRPVEQVGFGSPYRCGEHTVIFGALGAHERMIVDGEAFDLKPVVSASGARFEALDDPDTSFWSRGDRATVEVRGETLPECQIISGPQLPFVARGQEPGWRIEISDQEIHLLGDYGATELRFPRPEMILAVAEVAYHAANADRRLSVFIQPTLCADIATGMPHPYRVQYELDGERQSGCGGDPHTLLSGAEWEIESLAGEPPVAGSRMTIQFLEGNRVAGQSSCNRYMGGFKLTGEGLGFTQLAGTLMACEDPISQQETRFLAMLAEVYRFDLPATDQLVLHTAGGETINARRSR